MYCRFYKAINNGQIQTLDVFVHDSLVKEHLDGSHSALGKFVTILPGNDLLAPLWQDPWVVEWIRDASEAAI